MRKKLEALVLVLVLAALLDFLIGEGLGRLYRRTMTGEGGGLTNYALTKDAQILVLGSSRAKHHVIPSVLRDRLGAQTFNAGLNGQGFLYAVMLLDLWERRHPAPRAIVLQVDADTFRGSDAELQRTGIFSTHVDESERVREIVFSRGEFERVKFASRSYRYNGKVFPVLKNTFVSADLSFDGFESLVGTLDPATIEGAPVTYWRGPLVTARTLNYLEEIVAYCRRNDTQLYLVHSPEFREQREAHDRWVEALNAQIAPYPEVRFLPIDEITHPEAFANRPDLFRDEWHLNESGARIFSELLASGLAESTRSSK